MSQPTYAEIMNENIRLKDENTALRAIDGDVKVELIKARADVEKWKAVAYYLAPPTREPDAPEGVSRTTGNGQEEFLLAEIKGLKSHTFNGVDYEVMLSFEHERGLGWCSQRDDPQGPLLWIDSKLRGPHLVEVSTHEAVHACFGGELDEPRVDRIAKDISSFVFRMLLARDSGARRAAGLPSPAPCGTGGGE